MSETSERPPLSAERLAEIRQRCEAIVSEHEDRWVVNWPDEDDAHDEGVAVDAYKGVHYVGTICELYSEAVAAFIAHARTDLPALLAEVERLAAENAQLKYDRDRFHDAADAQTARRDQAERRVRDLEARTGPGTPSYRLDWLLAELDKRFPGAVRPLSSSDGEHNYLAAIDSLRAEAARLRERVPPPADGSVVVG